MGLFKKKEFVKEFLWNTNATTKKLSHV